jgi:GDP-L-fucose synthase
MPTNLFGPGDRYDLAHGHVVAALIMKIHAAKVGTAKTVELWGSGRPLREFLFSDDMADGCVFLMKNYSDLPHVNLGTGTEMSICELAEAIAKIAGWSGTFTYDTSKPDGMMRKVMNVGRMRDLGWTARTEFTDGMRIAYDWYVANVTRTPAAC